MEIEFSRKLLTILTLLMVTILAVVVLTPFLSGCTALTANPSEPAEEEKTQEELAQEREEERLQKEEEQRQEEERRKEERRLREEALREELGPFFVPLPPLDQEENPRVKARALYITGNIVGLERRFHEMLDLVDSTELNSLVIDVKNDHGVMSYRSEVEIVQEAGANKNVPIKDIKAVMETLKERDVYPIARVVVFKDPNLPEYRNDWAIQRNEGGIWREKRFAWVNPYEKKVWDYNIAIAKEAALLGFREIQFDYVRFPENARRVDREAYYPGNDGTPKEEVIQQFIAYAREELEEYNVHIAADVFGVISTSWGDSDQIGQNWELISPLVDYICPMVYPSHYGPGYFGYSVPDANPEGVIRHSLTDAIKRNAPLENPAIIRPWLQSFTASWVRGNIPYGAKEVRLQIDAAMKLGIDEYMIWNAVNRYHSEAFLSQEEFDARLAGFEQEREAKGQDTLGRTKEEAMEAYMEAMRKKSWREGLVLQSTNFSLDHDEYRAWMQDWTGRVTDYTIRDNIAAADQTTFTVDVTIRAAGEEHVRSGETFEVIKENTLWRVKPSTDFLEFLTVEHETEAEESQAE